MEQPAHAIHKPGRKRGDIEFIAPYALADCVSRIRSTNRRVTREENGGIDSICEPVTPDSYRFTLTRTLRSTKPNRTQTYAMVEADGYLKSVDNGLETLVVARFHITWTYRLIGFVFVALAIAGVIISLKDTSGFIFIVVGILFFIFYYYQAASDKRALRKAIYHVLSDEFIG